MLTEELIKNGWHVVSRHFVGLQVGQGSVVPSEEVIYAKVVGNEERTMRRIEFGMGLFLGEETNPETILAIRLAMQVWPILAKACGMR